jgi:hypothetical protein
MRYRVTAIWEEELHERDIVSAREMFELDLRDSMDHLEFEDLRIDLAEIPLGSPRNSTFPSTTFPAGSLDPDQAMRDDPELYPDDAPGHPWDQGLWIFPEGHPLAGAERAARGRYDEAAGDVTRSQWAEGFKQGILESGQKIPAWS